MKKYINDCSYCENTSLAIRLANEIVEYLNCGEYDDLDRAIYETIESNQIYYADQWELMQNYQTPATADYNKALEALAEELFSIIKVEEHEEELGKAKLEKDED